MCGSILTFQYEIEILSRWNPEDISKDELKSQLKDFSEGSVALEMCLRVLWKRNVPTKACCKGAHLSYTHDGYVSLAVDPYIAFMLLDVSGKNIYQKRYWRMK